MFNIIKKMFKDYVDMQNELAKQGVFNYVTHYGAVHYIDLRKKMAEGDQSSTK